MSETPQDRQREPKFAVPESTMLNTLGKIVGFALDGGVGIGLVCILFWHN
jgi:hypothetical protein